MPSRLLHDCRSFHPLIFWATRPSLNVLRLSAMSMLPRGRFCMRPCLPRSCGPLSIGPGGGRIGGDNLRRSLSKRWPHRETATFSANGPGTWRAPVVMGVRRPISIRGPSQASCGGVTGGSLFICRGNRGCSMWLGRPWQGMGEMRRNNGQAQQTRCSDRLGRSATSGRGRYRVRFCPNCGISLAGFRRDHQARSCLEGARHAAARARLRIAA